MSGVSTAEYQVLPGPQKKSFLFIPQLEGTWELELHLGGGPVASASIDVTKPLPSFTLFAVATLAAVGSSSRVAFTVVNSSEPMTAIHAKDISFTVTDSFKKDVSIRAIKDGRLEFTARTEGVHELVVSFFGKVLATAMVRRTGDIYIYIYIFIVRPTSLSIYIYVYDIDIDIFLLFLFFHDRLKLIQMSIRERTSFLINTPRRYSMSARQHSMNSHVICMCIHKRNHHTHMYQLQKYRHTDIQTYRYTDIQT